MTEKARASGDSTGAILQQLPVRGFDPSLRGVRGTIRFDVADAGTWRVRIDDGYTELSEGAGASDLTIACEEADFADLLLGVASLMTATLRGAVEVSGDLALALRFHGLHAVVPAGAPELSP